MKSLKIVGPREIEFFDRPEPRMQTPQDVKIQVKYAGICVDDIPFFRRDRDMLAWGSNIIPLNGHEMSGIVVECGSEAKKCGIRIGDRVSGYAWDKCGCCYYCRTGRESHCLNLQPAQGTLSEYIVWKARQLMVLPDEISLEEGCLTDPVGYAMHGVDRSHMKIGNSVLIVGGTINGQLALQMAKLQGACKLTLIDEERTIRELGKEMGAEYTIDPIKENVAAVALGITGGLGYDIIFETSGSIPMLILASKLLARQGTIMYSNMYGLDKSLQVSMSELYMKEASLIPYNMAPYMLPRIRNMISKLKLKPLITKIYDYQDAEMAYKDTEIGLYPHILVKVSDD